MKSRIFLYLFVFSALVALYLGISGNRTVNSLDKQLRSTEEKITRLTDSLQESQLEVLDMQYFSLENNDEFPIDFTVGYKFNL